MSDYKLAPVEPTQEMVEAAADAYMPFGDMDLALRMAILAAPAVQGEPVYLYRRRDLHEFITCNHERYAKLSAKPHLYETKVLYTAPQPAPAVQNKPMSFCEDAALSLAERTFSSEVDEQLAEDAIQYARRLHTLYATPQPAEQQPCPEGVREGAPYDDSAFESLCREHEIWGTPAAAQCAVFWEAGKRVAEQKPDPEFYIEHENLRRAMSNMGIAARAALAAYRKGGEA